MFSCSHCGLIHGSKMASQKTITISRLDEASQILSCFRLSVCWVLHESKTQRNHERLHKFASRPHKHPRIEGIEYGILASVNWHQTHKAQPGTTNKVYALTHTSWEISNRLIACWKNLSCQAALGCLMFPMPTWQRNLQWLLYKVLPPASRKTLRICDCDTFRIWEAPLLKVESVTYDERQIPLFLELSRT